MISVYGYKDGNYVLLDAPQTSVELSFQISDLRRPNVKTAPFSLTFEMPFTATNNDFFGHQQDPSLRTTDFDLNRKTSARLHDNNVPLTEGVIQVTSIDVSAKAYKCRFYSETADLFDAIKGKSWADVWRDSSGNVNCPLDHPLTASNVKNTWVGGTQPNGSLPTYTIVYALTDTGIPMIQGWDYPAYYNGYWDSDLKIQNLRPCVKVSYLLDEILAMAGFGRDTDACFFSNTTYNSPNLYMMCGMTAQSLPTRLSYGFYVQNLPSQNTLALGSQNVYGVNEIIYWDVPPSGNFYDPDGQMTVVSWSPQVDQNATFEFSVRLSAYTGSPSDPLPNMQMTVSAGGVQASTTFEYEDAVDTPFIWSPTVIATGGTNVFIYIQGTGNAAQNATLQYDITWSLVEYNVFSGDQNTTIQFTEALGQLTLDKFIQGLCDTYNLVLNVETTTRMVSFQLYDEWLESGGGTIDWTDKIDVDGPMEILPSSDYVPRQMFLSPSEGKDHRNAFYERKFGVRKGSFRFESRNDFAIDTQTVGDAFSLLRNTYLKGNWFNDGSVNTNVPVTNVIITELWSEFDGTKVTYESTPNALCYYHGLQDLSEYPLAIDGAVTEAALFTAYSGAGADSDIFSLEYSLSAPDLVENAVLGTAVNGLFDKFWYNYLQSIFSSDARVLKCQARLTPNDIRDLDFSRYINVRNVQYRIISVSNYAVGSSGLCNLTLFKRADGFLFDCGLTPTVQADGRVTWQDASGLAATPTELCCTSYGYTWNAGNGTCSVTVNRTAPISSNDVDSDVGGAVNQSTGESLSNTGNPVRVFSPTLQSPVTTEAWDMFANTRGTLTSIAKSLVDQTVFEISPQRIVNVAIEWLAVNVDGGNKGESSSGLEEVLLSTVDSSTSKNDGQVYGRGLPGYSIDVVVTDNVGGSRFEIECSGPVGADTDWFLSVRTTMYNTNKLKPLQPFLFALFQDGDQILFENNDIMEFNDQ